MADKETGLNITVGAVADENSAKQAVKNITNAVDSSVKGGRIKVPVDITIPIDKTKTKLTKAQKDIATELSRMTTKGFSASGKDMDSLTSKFNEFAKAFDQAGKGRQNKIFKEIRKQVEALQKAYKDLQRTEKATHDYEAKIRKTERKTRKKADKYNPDFGTHSKKEIKSNERAYKNRIMKGWQQTGPKGFKRNVGFDSGVATSKTLIDTDRGGSYPSNYARQMRISELAAVEWMKKSLRTYFSENIADDYAKALQNGKNKNNISDEQKSTETANLISNELTKILGGLEANRPDASIDKFNKYLEATLQAGQIGKGGYDAILLALNKTFHRYFNTNGTIGLTDGNKTGVGAGHIQAQQAIAGMIKSFKDKLEKGFADKIVKAGKDVVKVTAEEIRQLRVLAKIDPRAAEKEIDRILKGTAVTATKKSEKNNKLEQEVNKLTQEEKHHKQIAEQNLNIDKIENSAERVADSTSGKKTDNLIKDAEDDLSSGFNTDSNAMEVLSTLQSILAEVQSITKNGLSVVGLQKGQTNTRSNPSLLPVPAQPKMQQALSNIRYFLNHGVARDIPSSEISTTVKDPHSWITKLKDAFAELTNTTANYKVIMAKTSEEQDKMAAARIRKYGISRGTNATDTGDKTMIARRLSLFRNKDYFKTLFKDINITDGIKIDTTDITDRLAKALSGKEMFKAQTGGWLRNILGAMTGGVAFAFQPSLEKSRSRVEGVNQIMANIRKVLNDTVEDIKDKESKLRGMKASGDLKLDTKGHVLESSSSEAKTLVLQLQESKDVLNSILADTKYVDEVVGKTHGRINGIIRQLGFTSQPLRKNNAILANLNAGLDKNGKALKYHTRLAELLGYSFRLISRHVGQTFKNLVLQLNPITHIKKAFQDFMGYNTKWQRTMNVIKYNLRAILRPAMEWIAQKIVNIIGFLDIISMKVQQAFGQLPVSLFDQAAADAEKMKEELEEAANVTAGFDELHDIGTDNSGAMDLMGEIYKPQLSQEWIDLANKIGDLFAGLIKGDLGFGEVMGKILEIAWEGLKALAKMIWDWFKQTAIGKWIIENWKHVLLALLNAFIAWKLLKLIGPMLLKAFTGWATEGAFGGLLSKIGTWIMNLFNATAFGRGMIEGITSVLSGKGGLLSTLKSIFVGHDAITAFGAWGETLGALFVQSLGVAIGGAMVVGGYSLVADDASYNIGVREGGGKKEDERSDFGGKLLGTAGGAIAGGFLAGGPLGALIGGIAGLITTSLAPAFEELEVASRKANNEMQKIQYYEGMVTGAQSEVNNLDTLMDTLNKTLENQTQKVYKEGENLGITRARMDELIDSVKNGTYHTGLLTGKEKDLAGSLEQLSWQQEKNEETTKRLTEAKKKLEKAQLDLAIAQDIEAGNFELAAARVEYAYASELYTVDEATGKMVQIVRQGSAEQQKALVKDMSPEIRSNFASYTMSTANGIRDLNTLYWSMSEYERQIFSKDYAYEASAAMGRTLQAMQKVIDHNSIGSTFFVTAKGMVINAAKQRGIDISQYMAHMDVGSNYVPNDGIAYLHQGEAVIPAKYNTPYKQESSLSNDTLETLVAQVAQINAKVDRGIPVTGEFIQRGSDLLATVQKAENKLNNALLSNKLYAR